MSSPIAAHMFDFCDPNLFAEALHNSEVSSCSGCCYDDTSYTNDLSFSSFPSEITSFHDPTTAPAAPCNNLSVLHDSHTENQTKVSASTNYPSSMPVSPQNQVSSAFSALPYMPTHNDHFDLASMQIPLADVEASGLSHYSSDTSVPLGTCPSLGTVFEEDALSSMPPSYVRMGPASPSSSFLDHPGMGGYLSGSLNGGMCPDISGIFPGNIMGDSGLITSQELEFQGENCGVYCSNSVYGSGELQVISESQQQMMKGCGSPVGLTSDMSNLEEQGGLGKAPKLTLEERKVKIHRYMKKRTERNFSKKIKYACRKTLADSRPRVRGRFAKNDEFGETARPSRSNHEEELDDDEGGGVVVKEEEMLDSSDILAHLSGVNSFKRNFAIPSWI
ncbi:uncharacterized protein [Aristolochia californica]